jgi:hypothetical protein
MEYSYEVEHDKTTDSDFPFPQFDLYDWYLKLGSLKHVNELYFHGTIPTWNNFVEHPSYDSFLEDEFDAVVRHVSSDPAAARGRLL